jgi:hypothetical protein
MQESSAFRRFEQGLHPDGSLAAVHACGDEATALRLRRRQMDATYR